MSDVERQVRCEQCKRLLAVVSGSAGKVTIRCPRCGAITTKAA